MKYSLLLLLIIISFFFIACEEDQSDATQVFVVLQSGKYRQDSSPGEKILYEISCSSLSSKLKSFSIKSFDIENGEKNYIDLTINESKYNYTFIYEVPAFYYDSVVVTLKVKAEDFENNYYELNLWVTVKGDIGLMPEMSGIILYSGSSRQRNAFSLKDPSQPFVMAYADSIDIDIFDLPNEIDPEMLSREWHTNTDVRFAKANSFNYANATASGIRAIYIASIRQKFITDIKPNDIIFIGRNDNAFGVIMVTDVVDNNGIDNDYYRFNVKLIKQVDGKNHSIPNRTDLSYWKK